LTSIKCDCCI